MTSFLDRILWGSLPGPMRGPEIGKAAYDIQRVGVTGRPQYPDTDIAALQTAYRRNEIVYAAIKAKATAAIDPRLLVQQRGTDDTWEEIAGHPFRRLMMRPNKSMDEAAFYKAAITTRDVTGVFYVEKIRAKGSRLPVALHPLDPARVAPIPGADGDPVAYEYKVGGKKITLDATDVLAWRHPDLISRYHGLSPLAVALGSVDADSAQTDFMRAFFNNAGVPSGMLKIKGRTVTDADAESIKARWRTRFGRQWGVQHDIAIMDENAEYQKMGANLDELQSDVLREFTETRVAMVFGVPPLIIYAFAGLKRATYSNLKEANASFWDQTMTPLFKDWRTFLLWNLLSDFEDEERIFGEQVRLHWDLSQVASLQDDVDAAQTRACENFKVGGITLNELRETVGLDADPVGDYYLRSMAILTVPAGTAAAPVVEDVPKRGIHPPVVKALRAAATTRIEQQIETTMRTYLAAQYRKAAEGVRSAA